MLVFKERGKPEYPETTSRSRVENQQQTQPTYDAGSANRTQATLVGGERSHHCAIPATNLRTETTYRKMKALIREQRNVRLNIAAHAH